jgi:hypothetical protein
VRVLTFYILLFAVVFQARCDFVMAPTKEQHHILYKFRKIAAEALALIRHAYVEESMCRMLVFEWHVRSDRLWRDSDEQSQEHVHNLL